MSRILVALVLVASAAPACKRSSAPNGPPHRDTGRANTTPKLRDWKMPDALEETIRAGGYKVVDRCERFEKDEKVWWTYCRGANEEGDGVTLDYAVFPSARKAEEYVAASEAYAAERPDDEARFEQVTIRDRAAILVAEATPVAPAKELMSAVLPKGVGMWKADGAIAAKRIRAQGWQIYKQDDPERSLGMRRYKLYFKKGHQAGELELNVALELDKSRRIEEDRSADGGTFFVHQYNGYANARIYDRQLAEAIALRRQPRRDQ